MYLDLILVATVQVDALLVLQIQVIVSLVARAIIWISLTPYVFLIVPTVFIMIYCFTQLIIARFALLA